MRRRFETVMERLPDVEVTGYGTIIEELGLICSVPERLPNTLSFMEG